MIILQIEEELALDVLRLLKAGVTAKPELRQLGVSVAMQIQTQRNAQEKLLLCVVGTDGPVIDMEFSAPLVFELDEAKSAALTAHVMSTTGSCFHVARVKESSMASSGYVLWRDATTSQCVIYDHVTASTPRQLLA